MEISVIIPTSKPDYYIWECLNSIKGQTLNKNLFEVLIILNGEKEPYYNDILNYIKKYKLENFRLIYTKQNGVSNARNIGLNNCNGNYIIFIDDDDYIDKNYLKEMNIASQKDKSAVVIANYKNFKTETKEIISKTNYPLNYETDNLLEMRRVFSNIGIKMIPMNIIKDTRFVTELSNGEDFLFMITISKNIKKILTVEKNTFYNRRVRKNSANFRKKKIKKIINNSVFLIKKLIKYFFNKEYKKIFILSRIIAILKGTGMQIYYSYIKN